MAERYPARNALHELVRVPSDLWRYLAWSNETKQQYGSILNFVVKERLRWTSISQPGEPPQFQHSDAPPLQNRADFAVLENDWPYGFAPGIRHFIVWTKTPIPVDDDQGDVTPESRQLIDAFVQRFFVDRLDHGQDRVLWFKNWVKLQSVRGVDHVHVLLKDVPQSLVDEWTVRKDL